MKDFSSIALCWYDPIYIFESQIASRHHISLDDICKFIFHLNFFFQLEPAGDASSYERQARTSPWFRHAASGEVHAKYFGNTE